ncbi:hypothetical protein OKW30_008119 [Paraburkholderia sp. Clong3]|uniref:hypothetical protein n=1 Tax=Paraburkholderia sp. Clong3 TaxID=2991061 RepID=UPI003D23E7F6
MTTEVMRTIQFDQSVSMFQQKSAGNRVDRASTGFASPVGPNALSDQDQQELISFAEIGLLIAVEFQKLQNAVRDYLSTALINEFKQMIFVLKKKNDAIDENFKAAIIKNTMEMVSGMVSLAFAGAGTALGAGKPTGNKIENMTKGMELGALVSTGFGKIVSSVGDLAAASVTKEAQQDQAEAEFASQNTDRYSKGIERLEGMLRDLSDKFLQALAAFRKLYERLTNSMKVA